MRKRSLTLPLLLLLIIGLSSHTVASSARLKLERLDLSEFADSGVVRAYVTLVELEGQVEEDRSAPTFSLLVDGKSMGAPEKAAKFQGVADPLDLVLIIESSALYGPPTAPAPPPPPPPTLKAPKHKLTPKRRHPRPAPKKRKPAPTKPVAVGALSPSDLPLEKVKEAVRQLLDSLGPRARVFVIDYGGEVTAHPPFRPAGAAAAAVEDLQPDDESGDLRLVDAVRTALGELGKPRSDGRIARRLIVLVSDGLNHQMDRKIFRGLGDTAKKAGVPIHAIAFSPSDERGPMLNLGEISKRSNGTFRWARTAADLQGQIDTLADELNKQYVLTFHLSQATLKGAKIAVRCEDLLSNIIELGDSPEQKLKWRWALAGAGAILVIGLVLFVARRRRGPSRRNAAAQQTDGRIRGEVVIVSGTASGQRATLAIGVITIGKGDCTLRIDDDPSISSRHAQIVGDQLTDLGSTNGTFVNNTRISGPTRLVNGDLVRVGNTQIKFRTDA